MNYLKKINPVTIFTFAIIFIDLLLLVIVFFYQIVIKPPEPVDLSNSAKGNITHSLIIAQDGTIYAAWLEHEAHKSAIIFAKSFDFGYSWDKTTAYETVNSGLIQDELKMDNLSMVLDSKADAHISFRTNIGACKDYGNVVQWSLKYITNKGGKWSSPMEIKDPWNSDWMGGIINIGPRKAYSEGVIGYRLDIDGKNVLHMASIHDGWWAWGRALYHHFKAEDSDWKTEEVRWHKAGNGTYEQIRLFYILRKMAESNDPELIDLGITDTILLKYKSDSKIAQYRSDVDSKIQGAPLLFVSPRDELYIFNPHLDENLPYVQSIKETDFWQNNKLIHNEIYECDKRNECDPPINRQVLWGPYKPVYEGNNEPKIAPGFIKAIFDSMNKYCLSVISKNRKQLYIIHQDNAPKNIYDSDYIILDNDIVRFNNTLYCFFIEEETIDKRTVRYTYNKSNGWQQAITINKFNPSDYNQLNLGRYCGASENKYNLPSFIALTVKNGPRHLSFYRLPGIPWEMAFRAFKLLVVLFFMSSLIVFIIFYYFGIIIRRRKIKQSKWIYKYMILLIGFLLIKDTIFFMWRDKLILTKEPIQFLFLAFLILLSIIGACERAEKIMNSTKKFLGIESREG